jgi:lipoprotein-releasing system ATP-binding protein
VSSSALPLVLSARNLDKKFFDPSPIVLLKDLSIDLYKGEAVAIVGRSGEGKSTLMHILGTLEEPCRGSLQIAGEKVTTWNKCRIRNKHLAFIFQAFHLFEEESVLNNILMPASIARIRTDKKSEAYRRACATLSLVGLSERAHFMSKVLSGGEKQRVAIARALCNDPDIILADEPSGNLDRETATSIHRLLIDLAHKKNKALLIVTHDRELAELCDKQYLLKEGKLQNLKENEKD